MNHRKAFIQEMKDTPCFGKANCGDVIRKVCRFRKYCHTEQPEEKPFGAKVYCPSSHKQAQKCQYCDEVFTSKRKLAEHACGSTRFNPKALNDSVDIKGLDENY